MHCINDERLTIENNKLRRNNNIKMQGRKKFLFNLQKIG